MSRLIFEKEYIAVIPSYKQTEKHKHNMMHLFVGKRSLLLECENGPVTGKVIILDKNIVHKGPESDLDYFLFIDPVSRFGSKLKKEYLKESFFCAFDSDELSAGGAYSPKQIKSKLVSFFGEEILGAIRDMDPRILELIRGIDSFEHIGKKIPELAKESGYSESYLTHLFKTETGIPLKNYMLMREFEYAYQKIASGQKITDAVLDAGFGSSSHFSDVCRKLTGISVMDVMRGKADK